MCCLPLSFAVMSSSHAGLAAKGGRKSGGRRAGGLSKSAAQADKSSLGGDTYPFDDAEANGESPCVDSKLQLGEHGVVNMAGEVGLAAVMRLRGAAFQLGHCAPSLRASLAVLCLSLHSR